MPYQPKDEAHARLRDKQWMEARYAEIPATTMAKELGIRNCVVYNWLHKHGIPITNRRGPAPPHPRTMRLRNREWLESRYADHSTGEIGAELGVAANTVSHWLHRHRIPVRIGSGGAVSEVTRQKIATTNREKAKQEQMRRKESIARDERVQWMTMGIDLTDGQSWQTTENIKLARDFLRQVLEDDTILDRIPTGSRIVLLPANNPELEAMNRTMADGRHDVVLIEMGTEAITGRRPVDHDRD